MEKTDFQKPKTGAESVGVMPRTLIIRPMEYKHPSGTPVYFSGVFGNDADSKEAGDVWVATFFDRNEAEAFVLASKTFGNLVIGVRLQLQVVNGPKPEEKPSADVQPVAPGNDGTEPPAAPSGG